ncbi:MAG: hypothetical protein GXP34_01235, partial [Actinobacteria bacterium]|nr:hypothetical protein [Actinomycetota bacterium]
TPAARALEAVAHIAENQTTTTVPGGPVSAVGGFVYVRAVGEQLIEDPSRNEPAYAALVSVTHETWIATDGSGRVRVQYGALRFPTAADQTAWEADGRPVLTRNIDDTAGPGGLAEDPSQVPADPDALQAYFLERANSQYPASAELLEQIANFLATAPATPQQRAAAYRVAAKIPNIELVGDVTDTLGRPGIAVAATYAVDDHQEQFTLIFSPHTGDLLEAKQDILPTLSGQAGLTRFSATFTRVENVQGLDTPDN